MLDVFLQTGGEASVVVEAGRGLGEVAVAAAGNRLLVTSCPPAKGTMAAALPADTLIKYQGDGALATRFTLDTATGAAASVQTTFQLDPTSAAADVTVLTIDYQGATPWCVSALTVVIEGVEVDVTCAGGLWLSMACDGTEAAPKQYPPTDTEDNVAMYGPFALASPCVDRFNLNIRTGTIDACSAAAAAEQGAAAAAGTAPTAGDDPTFIGSDGLAYHVLGEPWKYFNVVSSPSISMNAQFLPVKPGFVHGKITDTVLGTLHLAICDAATGRTLGVLFDVFSGEHHCTITPPGAPLGGNTPAPCASALASFGVSFSEEGAACLLRKQECGHVLASKLPAAVREEPTVLLGMGRFNISVAGAKLSLLRDLINRPEGVVPTVCAPLAKWPHVLTACDTLARMHAAPTSGGAASQEWRALPSADRLAVLSYLTAGNASQQMHFFNVQIDKLPFAQPDVHGLLGQRAVGPLPPMATTNELLAALDGALMSTEQPSPGAGTTIRATVAADGAAAAAPPMLQGEGAIEGSYLSYKVKYVSDHGPGSFAYSRFKCAAPPVEVA